MPVATQLQPYMPCDWPILTLQAPELVHKLESPIPDFFGRAMLYNGYVAHECKNTVVHIVGYSHTGPLAFEMALSVTTTKLSCESLCLIDPLPFAIQNRPTVSLVLERARMWDFVFGTLMLIETNFARAVDLEDIDTIEELGSEVNATSSEFITELSIIVDTALTLAREYPTFD